MGFLSILSALVAWVNKLAGLLHDRNVRQQGVQQEVIKEQAQVLTDVQQAQDIRAAVQRDLTLDSSKLHDDDGFKRPV